MFASTNKGALRCYPVYYCSITRPKLKQYLRILPSDRAFPLDALCLLVNLAGMEGFPEMFGVSMNDDGSVDPLSQLFRSNFIGVETGPIISQVRQASIETTPGLQALHTRHGVILKVPRYGHGHCHH